MSQTPTVAASGSNYQSIFDSALDAYRKKTKKDLRSHPLLAKLQTCDSPDTVLSVLREQIPGFDQSSARGTDDRSAKWLDSTVNVICAFSGAIGGGIAMAYPPAGVIFTGIAVLLSAAKDVSASEDALANIFERIENFLRRLETYIEVPPTTGMVDIIVKILVEVLSILAIVTKEIIQSRTRKYMKKLVGRTDIEDALGRLDRLTQEEVRMAAALGLKATQKVDGKIDLIIDDGQKIRGDIRQVADGIDDQKRIQIRQDLRNWLSPPDPSVNYNSATDARHEGTALWFTQGQSFKDWRESGSLLWIHGKPGSGKSVLSSSIIQDIEAISGARSAYVAYFFFDFKDKGKQDSRALLSSLVVQLSHQSDTLCDTLSRCYSTHQSGLRQPSDRTLTQCLLDMITVPKQVPIYLIVDALDECPNTTGVLSPRDEVVTLVEKLVKLNLPNLRLCITSRPEVDIRTTLEPLTFNRISLHDQSGQKKDIVDYVKSIVYSNNNMRRWRDEDKKLVIETLSERADGMFRWVVCQLEVLRQCLAPSVRRILTELPETLDETYERILQEIPKSNRVHAHRLLQCLTVAFRPLRVEELAEVLAVDFDVMGGIPKLNDNLRWEDQEQAVLSACSSLIAVVEDSPSRVVQFSHFSVKEFLMSGRLATSKIEASHYYHIRLEPAHTIMAQACLGVLLRLDPHIGETGIWDFPLAQYAAQHFGEHVGFEKVLSRIQRGIDDLLDADKPHFAAWLRVRRRDWDRDPALKPDAAPLYHVAEFGFCSLVDHLISKRPKDLGVRGPYGTPLHAALYMGHADVAKLLVGHCVDVDDRGIEDRTLLHLAVDSGLLGVTRMLVERHASINVRDSSGRTPLHPTKAGLSRSFDDVYFDVMLVLLEHGAGVDTRDDIDYSSPLHVASYWGGFKVAQLLLDHGANINVRNENGRTPLHQALSGLMDHHPEWLFDTIRFLLEHGADVDALDDEGKTPLHLASHWDTPKGIRLLLEHGASVHIRNNEGQTPLEVADNNQITQLLSEHIQSEQRM